MAFDDILDLTALEQARLVRTGAVSSAELVEATLDRIHRRDAALTAFVSVFDRAVETAKAKDRLRHRLGPDRLPLFHGVPMGIKDLNVVRWTRTRFGSRAVPSLPLPLDDNTVAPLRKAGFVFVGKTTTSEFGAMPFTEPDIHPPTRNPWAPDRTAGGSSGGAGAAVAAGMLPAAQGSDGAGSIRIPAAFCHLYGLKPARGRVANQFGLPDRRLLYTSGPITRSVDDAAALLDVMAGLVDGRPHWAPPPPRPFRERPAGPPPRLRLGAFGATPVGPTDPEIAAAFAGRLRLLESLGHDVVEVSQPECTVEEFLPLWQWQVGSTPLCRWRDTQPVTRWLGEAGRRLRGADVARLFDALNARFAGMLGDADLWVTPTVAVPPPPVHATRGLEALQVLAAAAEVAAFTALVNLIGLPAASVPMGFTAAGLPMGLQLIGGHHAEADVLALSWQLEEATPWRHLRPRPT